MRKLCTLLLCCAATLQFFSAKAQNVGINDDGSTPHSSAMLDVKSTAKGFLAPRMTAAQRSGIANPATGLLVYQIDAAQGIYVNQGTPASPNWILLAGVNNVWSLNGNAGTTSSNFIGTTDEQPLLFRVNNLPAGSINPTRLNVALGF